MITLTLENISLHAEEIETALDHELGPLTALIIEEMGTNALTHGQAQQFLATTEMRGNQLILTIKDDGISFNTSEAIKESQRTKNAHLHEGGNALRFLSHNDTIQDVTWIHRHNHNVTTFVLSLPNHESSKQEHA